MVMVVVVVVVVAVVVVVVEGALVSTRLWVSTLAPASLVAASEAAGARAGAAISRKVIAAAEVWLAELLDVVVAAVENVFVVAWMVLPASVLVLLS